MALVAVPTYKRPFSISTSPGLMVRFVIAVSVTFMFIGSPSGVSMSSVHAAG